MGTISLDHGHDRPRPWVPSPSTMAMITLTMGTITLDHGHDHP
jgi:hypothetical protein